MNIGQILKDWNGILIRDEDYFLEKIYELCPENCYVIDQYPFVVHNNEKYKQVEISYDRALRSQNTFAIYLKEEEKLKQVMKKLWLYDIVEVETNLNSQAITKLKRAIDTDKHELLEIMRKKYNGNWIVEQVDEVDLLVELGARERACTSFVFRNLRIIITTNALDMSIFISDIQNKHILEKIVMTEGLYLTHRTMML